MCRTLGAGISEKLGYCFYMVGPMMHALATSRVVMLDGYCIPASILRHKNSLKIVQMWHAMGAFKRFGYAVLDKEEGYSHGLARAMNMHRNYDHIFVSNDICKPLLAEAYDCSVDKMLVMPLPRVDFIRKENYVEDSACRIYDRYPALKEKKNILYAPTFRKGADNTEYVRRIIERADYSMYNIIVRPHPLMKDQITSDQAIIDYDFSSMEMLAVADYVVTDYSAFILEAALAGKPLFLFVPDRDKYLGTRGFFTDIAEECPGTVSTDAEELFDAIGSNDCNLDAVSAFAEKYVRISDDCTGDIVKFINNLM